MKLKMPHIIWLIQYHKSDFFKQKYQFLNTQDNFLWKVRNNILKIKNISHPLKKVDSSLTISNEENFIHKFKVKNSSNHHQQNIEIPSQ